MAANVKKAQDQADEVRRENYIREPDCDIRKLVNSYGFHVADRDFGPKYSEIAGFINADKQLIVVSRADSPARQAFTIAHELGHWLLHREHVREDKYAILYRTPLGRANDDALETEANCFAANLLVPKNMLDQHLDKSDHDAAKLFGVSEDLIRYRRKNIADGGY